MMSKISLILSFIIIISCLSGCAFSKKTETPLDLSINDFNKITLGQKKEDILKALGKPSEVRKTNSDVWIYDNHDKESTQRGAINFDSATGDVSGITVIPRLSEKEALVENLLKDNFDHIVFETFQSTRCHRDFSPNEVYYLNINQGIIIEKDKRSEAVTRISRMRPEILKKQIQTMKSCDR